MLMVRPASFGFNPQTAASNAFQHAPERSAAAPAPHWREHAEPRLARVRRGWPRRSQRAGVAVIVADDTRAPAKPDAIFPNNWVSFHRDGTVVLYPMLAPNRRLERRDDVIAR